MIQRKEYLQQLITNREKQIIKVVTGVRRCGKSTLFSLYINYLKSVGVSDEQIISINLEDIDYEELLNYKSLYQYIKEKLCKDKYNYVFIDEVQNCQQFEKAVDSLFIKENVDVYITGSNAYMLSGELATLLSGRYITIDMLPLSFYEYCEAEPRATLTVKEKFNQYLRYGSFPYVASMEQNDETVRSYIDGIYNTILIKDVAKREGITDIVLLENIVKTIASSIGSPISIKKISDTINSAGRKISVNTVDHYVHALTDSYIFYKADRYDIKGRQYLKTLSKYYLVDTGIRNMLLSSAASDIGHLIENIVYLELLHRGYKVNIGKLAEKEVDFVASNMDGITYYQVSATVLDEKTLARELEPLRRIPDHYPKILLTLDEIGAGANYEGIRQINLIEWLLNK
ncbi:ATP-binding protein [Aminipila terrae]|uniref:AAA family ATPase n=1 Tax=Aminipila terrae TaxID=2697030 RepID=A0A6P1MRL6_9FIRM|nr:ATP-binding protein [Aminipila terrae]QHI73635.1 AAA family ATPase [Aminipila terrae]